MSSTPVLSASPRDTTGSNASRKERAAGRIPANLYGHGEANASVSLDAHDLELALAGTSQIFTLQLPHGEQGCLVREVQYDTFGQRVLHVDFTRIDLSEEVNVEVALNFVGTAKGVTDGGNAIIHHPTLAVHCRADSIPESLEVDVSGVEIGSLIHANELTLPAGVKLDPTHIDEGAPIFGVAAAKAEEPETTDEDAPADGDAPTADGGDAPAADDAGGDDAPKSEG